MKIGMKLGVLALGIYCCMALQGQAQTVSPRTGQEPVTHTLTFAEFDKLPSEVQVIMKQHPDRFFIIPDGKGEHVLRQGGNTAGIPEATPVLPALVPVNADKTEKQAPTQPDPQPQPDQR